MHGFGEPHQQKCDGNVFCEVRMNPDTAQQLTVSAVANFDLLSPPIQDDARRKPNVQQAKQSRIERSVFPMPPDGGITAPVISQSLTRELRSRK